MSQTAPVEPIEYHYVTGRGTPLRFCPECRHPLTETHGVDIHLIDAEGAPFEEQSKLDEDGRLEDPAGHVAGGQHSHTACGGCGEMLINLPDAVEQRTGG